MVNFEQLKKITNSGSRSEMYITFLNDCIDTFKINSKLREFHFLAQILHESGNLIYTKELASGQAYEGRKDLGNTVKGYGVKYKGRGLIQITGFYNYKKLSEFFDVDFINNPELLETPQYAMMSAGWFWQLRNLNKYADLDDIKRITKLINGGYNGLQDRINWYNKCKLIIE